jgi:hypothetical protein
VLFAGLQRPTLFMRAAGGFVPFFGRLLRRVLPLGGQPARVLFVPRPERVVQQFPDVLFRDV